MKKNTTITSRPSAGATNPLSIRGLIVLTFLTVFCLFGHCFGQGTMTIAFQGQAPGTESLVGSYYGSQFWFSPTGTGGMYLSGGGIAGQPDNGTDFLYLPNGGVSFYWDIPPSGTLPSNAFSLLSFVAAECGSPVTLEVIGFDPFEDLNVTNYFSLNSESFQTFSLPPSFNNLGSVEILGTWQWALDNVLVNEVPEPSTGVLMLIAALCAAACGRVRRMSIMILSRRHRAFASVPARLLHPGSAKPASRKKVVTIALELEHAEERSRRTPATWLLLSLCLHLLAPSLHAGPAVQAWVQRYAGASGGKVAVDPQGNVVVAAQFSGWHGGIIKYSDTGVPLWTNIWGVFPTVVQGMALDNSGNVFVIGYWDLGMGAPAEYETFAYSSNGAPLWTNYYNGPANLGDVPTAVAADSSGNVYVTGYALRNEQYGQFYSCATLAYSSIGTPLWTNLYSAGALSPYTDCKAKGLAVDDAGNVYVMGYTVEYTEGPASGYAIIAYSSTGASLWVNSCNGCEEFLPMAIAARGNGNVYAVMGANCGGYLTSAYSNVGTLWANQQVATCSLQAYADAIALGRNGNVYVTGYDGGGGTGYDYLTAAYSSAGTLLWTNRYAGRADTNDYTQALAVGGSGNVYVTGYSSGTNGSDDYLTIAYSSNGVALWTNRFNEPGGSQAYSLAVDSGENVYVTGSSGSDCVTIKYMPSPSVTFSAIDVLPGPTCQLTLAVPTNITFYLEASPDLTNWLTLTNFPPLPATSLQYTDALAPGFPARFYRTVWSP